MNRIKRRQFRPGLERLEELQLLSALTPAQIAHAYSLDSLGFVSGGTSVKADGSGQTIAVVDAYHDPNLANDVAAFDRTYNLPGQFVDQLAGILTQVDQSGGRTDDGWAIEEALDVEWIHAIAPGARIVVVEARSASLQDLIAAVDTAHNLSGVSVVSMSWGSNEFSGQSRLEGHFTTPSGHQGVTFVAASGDGSASSGAQWPASSANVLSVGGTTLTLSASGGYKSETGWYSSGGGVSRATSEPGYQTSVQRTGARTTPDVSLDASPQSGYSVYFTTPSTGNGTWVTVGGTSASAQVWAALIAIADQGRSLSGQSSLDGASQTLPAIYALPSSDFHDVTRGSNGYSAHRGYDLVNGRGTPIASRLVTDLVQYSGVSNSRRAASRTTSTSRTARHATDSVVLEPAVVGVSSSAGNRATTPSTLTVVEASSDPAVETTDSQITVLAWYDRPISESKMRR